MSDTYNQKQYWIPPHIRACVTPTGAVLLDLKRNRYFGLGTKEVRSLAALALNWAEASIQAGPLDPMRPEDAQRLAEPLIEAGLLSTERPNGRRLPIRAVDLLGKLTSVGFELQCPVSIRFRHILKFVRACLWARRAVRSRQLYSVAWEVSRSKIGSAEQVDVQRTTELVCIFRRLRPFAFAAKDQCLFHALALLKFLASHGTFATWVVGVRPRPWSAHSWLQLENLVLDCNPEEICGYTPILAI